jgi:hypothetical protein
MAIAEVIDVKNSVFINGSPASDDQMIDYGDVIETYDISKGLQESFLSEEIEDDGILTIQFIEKEEEMSIKPHCKVIFKPGGAWAGANTVLLDSKSEYVTLDKPKFRKTKAVAVVVKAKMSNVNDLEAKPGMTLHYEDVIKTGGDGFLTLIYLEDKQLFKIRSGTEIYIRSPGMKGRDLLYGPKFTKINKKIKKDFVITPPTSVTSVKG